MSVSALNLAAIRSALADVLETVPGIRSAAGWPTEQIGATPFAFVGFLDDAITAGSVETHLYSLPITVLIQRKGANLPAEVLAAEAIIPDVLAAIRANQTLGLPDVYRVEPMRIRGGVFSYASVEWTGIELRVDIKQSFHASYA